MKPASILFALLLILEPCAAQASTVLLHALSDNELASASAGQALAIRFEADAHNGAMPAAASAGFSTPNLVGIRTIRHNTGASSLTEAATSIVLAATLRR